MMNKIENAYRNLLEEWRTDYKGKCTINFGPNVSPMPLVLGALYEIFTRDPTRNVVVITENNDIRKEFYNYITNTDNKENNEEFKKLIGNKQIKALTAEYATNWYSSNDWFLFISIGVNYYDKAIERYIKHSKFHLICLTADTVNTHLFEEVSVMMVSDVLKGLKKANFCPPVEELQVGLTITNEEDVELIKKYDTYIRECLSLFGEFNNIALALYGDPLCNVSAIEYCSQLAHRNGWDESLDMTIDYNKQLDKHFNPIAIQEKARLFYDIKTKRANLVAGNSCKLDKILEICKENAGKKILIINKNADFAATVTNYLNQNLEHYCNGHRYFDACYNYHNNVEEVFDIDIYGKYRLVKSGVDKGKRRILKAKAQMSNAVMYFNNNYTNIISTNNMPCVDFTGQVDIIILTSALCETIETYLYRLNGLSFNTDKLYAYRLYCLDTFEVNSLKNSVPTDNHVIVNLCENDDSMIKNSMDCIVI